MQKTDKFKFKEESKFVVRKVQARDAITKKHYFNVHSYLSYTIY